MNKKFGCAILVIIILILLLGGISYYFKLIPQLVYVGGEYDFSVAKGSEFDSNNLDMKYWQIMSGDVPNEKSDWCFDSNSGEMLKKQVFGTCINRDDTAVWSYSRWSVDTTTHDLVAFTQPQRCEISTTYKNIVIGRDYIINVGLYPGGTGGGVGTLIDFANCNAGSPQGRGYGFAKGPTYGFGSDELQNVAEGQFRIISSKLEPNTGVLIVNGREKCQFDWGKANPDKLGKVTLTFVDGGRPNPPGGGYCGLPFVLHPILERIPFEACSLNRTGSSLLMMSQTFPANRSFDKFSFVVPPEKFCLNFGAFLYDPERGFESTPEVYQKLQAGKQVNSNFDIKVVYLVTNKDPVTGGVRYGQYPSSCGNGLVVSTNSGKCEPLGGFVDLCTDGELDVERSVCIHKLFDKCEGVVSTINGTRVCSVFLPDMTTLCEPGTIILNGTDKGKCSALKIECDSDEVLIKVSPSEYKCQKKVPIAEPDTTSVIKRGIVTTEEMGGSILIQKAETNYIYYIIVGIVFIVLLIILIGVAQVKK